MKEYPSTCGDCVEMTGRLSDLARNVRRLTETVHVPGSVRPRKAIVTEEIDPTTLSDADWKARLSPDQYEVLRQRGRPNRIPHWIL